MTYLPALRRVLSGLTALPRSARAYLTAEEHADQPGHLSLDLFSEILHEMGATSDQIDAATSAAILADGDDADLTDALCVAARGTRPGDEALVDALIAERARRRGERMAA